VKWLPRVAHRWSAQLPNVQLSTWDPRRSIDSHMSHCRVARRALPSGRDQKPHVPASALQKKLQHSLAASCVHGVPSPLHGPGEHTFRMHMPPQQEALLEHGAPKLRQHLMSHFAKFPLQHCVSRVHKAPRARHAASVHESPKHHTSSGPSDASTPASRPASTAAPTRPHPCSRASAPTTTSTDDRARQVCMIPHGTRSCVPKIPMLYCSLEMDCHP